MGQRGPAPQSGVYFRGLPVVLRGRTPSILVEPGTPMRALADARGYVAIHRLVASEALGRWLTPSDAVQWVDGDPWNWAPGNLRVVRRAAHLPRGRYPRASTP